jgi:hypothetical protein
MKLLFFIVFLSIGMISCQKEDTANTTNDSTSSVNEFLRNANGFRITELIEEGRNKTSQFSTFLFLFKENGIVTAAQSDTIISGTYLVFRDDSKTELRMTFPNTSILSELSDDWYFISQKAHTIRFEDNGDRVQFQKQ